MAYYKQYPATTWAKIKEAWMSGQFTSVLQLHHWVKTCGIKEVPGAKVINNRMAKEGDWAPKLAAKEAALRIEERAIEYLASKGMPHESVLDELINAIQRCKNLIALLVSESKKAKTGMQKVSLAMQISDAQDRMLPWMERYEKLTGSVAPTKKIIEVDMEAKWRVAQLDEANRAYKMRFGQAEVVSSHIPSATQTKQIVAIATEDEIGEVDRD